MARPIWKGMISFGLVNIPVSVHSAERHSDLGFKLIDSRNAARIRYERVNEETGEEVPWDSIVKGYEYDSGSYVLLSEKELASASPELTKTIEIEQFVELEAIDSVYFDRPYYIVPGKGGDKGYILLREAMNKTGMVGIAKVVIRTRQYLAAVLPEGNCLVLNLLRFTQEVVPRDEFDIPGREFKKYKVTEKEIELAQQLVQGMSTDWSPETYHDEYRDALMKMIQKKVNSGKTAAIAEPEVEEAQADTSTLNFAEMLKQSLASKKKPAGTSRRKTQKSAKARKKKVG